MKKPLGAQNVTWQHLGDVVDSSWRFMTNRLEVDWVVEGLPGQESWVCAIDSLSDQAPVWCTQWFGGRQCKRLSNAHHPVDGLGVVTVNLCEGGRQWSLVVVDLFVPVILSVAGKSGLLCAWPTSGEFCFVVLQKAYAKLSGSYSAIALKPTRCILEELTGVPTMELFPRGPWRHFEVLDMIGRMEEQRKKTKKRISRRLFMVSFQAIDEHHCAFQLLGAASPSSRGFILRDPTRVFLNTALSKLGRDGGVTEEKGKCILAEKAFFQLGPTVFEVLADHTNSWRKRKIIHSGQTCTITSQIAVSCASLQTLVVRGFTMPFDDLNDMKTEVTSIAVDRIGEDDSWTRLGDEETLASGGQCVWTASAGEYLVTISAKTERIPDNDAHRGTRKLTLRDVQDNLRLLFQILDQDRDCIVSHSEFLGLFRVHEQVNHVELGEISECIDEFIEIHSSQRNISTCQRGLNQEDWVGAYQSFVDRDEAVQTSKPSEDEQSLASMVSHDLLMVVGVENIAEIDVGDLVVLKSDVFSDRDDVVLVSLN